MRSGFIHVYAGPLRRTFHTVTARSEKLVTTHRHPRSPALLSRLINLLKSMGQGVEVCSDAGRYVERFTVTPRSEKLVTNYAQRLAT